MTPKNILKDKYERIISYLRISLTDRCNLRCIYCMPENEDGIHTKTGVILNHVDLLTYEEILKITKLSTQLGVKKIRLTGGEPLVRKGVLGFIQQLQKIEGIEDLSLTTNGVYLNKNADFLYEHGVRRLNISLDSLNSRKFLEITKRDEFEEVYAGIKKAQQLGFKIKLNVVAMKSINSDEFIDFAKFAIDNSIQVRFIEFMPLGKKSSWSKDRFISSDDIIKQLQTTYQLSPSQSLKHAGPAKVYQIVGKDGAVGEVGVISPLSHHFCDQCNRLRLTSEGSLRSCLLNDNETDLKKLIRNGSSDDELLEVIKETVRKKPKGHSIDKNGPDTGEACAGQMSRIGG